ncbi:4'-phosphopantetheinyl transferase family protein [Massilia consociata]|uniref:4'-phosphopantetheinyl transferase family protein n=1 Tax=Massilia consociata TaxID=760117 RepID=A0ABV6FAT9_9BURK
MDTLVWMADITALPVVRLAAYADWLGESERQRHVRFIRPERQRQFVAGRALLRRVLGQLLGVEPGGVLLQERPGQAPVLVHPFRTDVSFSISHSGSLVACAASTATAVGVDIERIDPARDVLALAGQAFTPDAVTRLSACLEEERVETFYRMWCLHEAGIKLGTGSAIGYVFMHAGFAGALCCARALAAAPVPILVDLACQ